MSDPVDTAELRQQIGGPQPMLDLGLRDTGAQKVAPGDGPVGA